MYAIRSYYDPEDVVLLGSEGGAAEALALAEAEAAGVALARDLVNRPSNHATAEMLAGEALALRITSYNVCYTKLLRAAAARTPG